MHIHKFVHDTQGAIYCIKCNKFRGWKPGKVIESVNEFGGVNREAWGYLLNGKEWTEQKEWEIKHNFGKYE